MFVQHYYCTHCFALKGGTGQYFNRGRKYLTKRRRVTERPELSVHVRVGGYLVDGIRVFLVLGRVHNCAAVHSWWSLKEEQNNQKQVAAVKEKAFFASAVFQDMLYFPPAAMEDGEA